MPSPNPLVTFDEAELNHLRQTAKWTFSERIQWLEEMTRFAIDSQKRNYRNLPKNHFIRIHMEAHPEEMLDEKALASLEKPS